MDKAEMIKELALDAKFEEIEGKFGVKYIVKAKEYVMSKISSLRGKKDATESKYATPFVLFALKQEEASVIDDIVVQFKLSEKEKESDDATVAQDEELEEDLLLEDSPNDNAYSPASSPIPVPATTADDGGAEAAAIATTDSAEQPGTPLVKKSKGFIPMQSKKVGTFQIPKNNSNSNSNTSNLSPPADVVKAKKVIPMVAKKAIAAANEKKAKRDASKVSFSKSASKEKSSSKPNKAKKDPLAPKKAVNAYMFFAAKQRAEIVGKSVTEVSKMTGELWRDMTDEDKEPFVALAMEDKTRAAREMEDYKLLNPGAVESSAPNKKCKLVEAVVKSKKRKIVESQNDERDEDDEDDDEDDESNAQLDASGSDDNDDDAESKSNSGIESSQDGSTPETKKAILNAASVRPETARVKAVRAKAAESVRANIFESKKPGPSSAQKVKKTTQVYPMNPNTVPDEELAHARVLPHITAHLPTDYIPTVDSKVVIIRQAYVEFLDTVPPRIMKTLDAARTQGKENICDLPSPTLTGDVTAVKKFETNLKETLYLVTVSIAKQAFTVLFAPYSSPLLTTDTYLVEKRAFTRSLSAPWLVVGAQVKRAFVIADNDTQVEYVEGIIYDIRENYLNDPYQSVLVTWVNQDADDKTWMYKLIQTDNLCSLWELEASDFVLIERIKAFTFPDALLRLNGVSVANKFKEVIDYLSSLDIAYPFLYHLEEDEDFIAAFPDPSDHLDLHSLRARCIKGHYKSDANAREGFATALDMLFNDLYRMVRNGKQYNSHNSEFQVWRLCDMFEKALNRLQGALQGATEASGHQSLAKKGRLNEGQENAACTPVKQVMRASVDDEFWNECEDV